MAKKKISNAKQIKAAGLPPELEQQLLALLITELAPKLIKGILKLISGGSKKKTPAKAKT
jgi:hypothetical protein